MSIMREVAELQAAYQRLIDEKQLTKKAMCDLCIPFRDKYGLKDSQALRIARKEMDLSEMVDLLEETLKDGRAIDADELEMFPYSEGSGTEEQIAEWIEQAGISEDDTADRARLLCWKVIKGCINVVKTQPTLSPPNEWISVEDELPARDGVCLVFTMRGSVTTAHFYAEKTFSDGHR